MSLLSSVRRRRTAAVAGLSAAALVALSACSSSASAPSIDGGGASGHLSAYNKIITAGPVASDSEINANPWAKKIKQQGYLRVGGTDSGPLFSLRDLNSGELTGFDAGLSQMLAHYITGKTDVKALTKLTITSVDTRETMLQNNTVDAVFATYSITPERAQKVDFAGPYYEAGQDIMVAKGNPEKIEGPDDLAGKTVCSVEGSTPAQNIRDNYPQATLTLFDVYSKCADALTNGQVDAVTTDNVILSGYVSEAEFDRTARSFENPDWAGITVHSYRVRWGEAPKDPRYAELDELVLGAKAISVPTLMIQGGADSVTLPDTTEGKDQYFTGGYRRVVLDGIGHFPTREAAGEVNRLVVEFLAQA